MKQYEDDPQSKKENPKWKMNVILADIDYNKDGLRFKVTSTEGQKIKLKAETQELRDKWTQVFRKINQKHFPLIYGSTGEEEEEEGGNTEPKTGQAPKQDEQTQSRISFDENFNSRNVFPGQATNETFQKDESNEETVHESHEEIMNKFKEITIVSKRKRHLMVAAIDFGSAYSGCAFSFVSSHIRNPLEINVMGIGKKGLESLKVPTILLLNPAGEFEAFGFEAEQKYAEYLENDADYANKCYYFSRFKMQLYNNKELKKSMTIMDISNTKEMKAVDVFAFCIEFIKDTVFGRAKEQMVELNDEDVHWVLTVPAIWNEAARQFMIDAAEKAGIDPDNLTLALEPEAAALCCKCLELQKKEQGNKAKLRSFDTGAKFLVVDLGGGTVDIIANEVLESGQLKEIHNATGGPWGGSTVNAEMWKLLRRIFGGDVVKAFISKNRDDYLELTRDIEFKKRTAKISEKLTFEIPGSLIKAIRKVNQDIVTDEFKDQVKLVRGNRLQISADLVRGIFQECITAIGDYVSGLLDETETKGVSTILLVGGYASCEPLKEAMKQRFSHLTVICPLDPDVVVLKGAVIMGHTETPIVGRIAKYHYGIAILTGSNKMRSFDRSFRPLTKTVEEFHTIITKGQPIVVNEVVTEYDFPIAFNQQEAFIRIYVSDDIEPPTTISEEHCRQIGHIRIKLPTFRKNTTLKIGISNNQTEFKVVARDAHTGKCFAGVCRFLN